MNSCLMMLNSEIKGSMRVLMKLLIDDTSYKTCHFFVQNHGQKRINRVKNMSVFTISEYRIISSQRMQIIVFVGDEGFDEGFDETVDVVKFDSFYN